MKLHIFHNKLDPNTTPINNAKWLKNKRITIIPLEYSVLMYNTCLINFILLDCYVKFAKDTCADRCLNAIIDYDISNLNLNPVGSQKGDFTILQILIWIERSGKMAFDTICRVI